MSGRVCLPVSVLLWALVLGTGVMVAVIMADDLADIANIDRSGARLRTKISGFGGQYDEEDGCAMYENYLMVQTDKLYRTNQIMTLHQLHGDVKDTESDLIFVDDVPSAKHPARFALSPDAKERILELLKKQNIGYTILTDNLMWDLDLWEFTHNQVQKKMYEEMQAAPEIPTRSRAPLFFMTYEHMKKFLKGVSRDNENARIINIGKSYEGRDMVGIAINDKRKELPGIWIDAGIDPRKWMTQATALYLITYILRYDTKDAKFLRENFRWYIIPNINPDGYVYTWTKDRFWRKTRSQHGNCYGVDLKRNWATADWNENLTPCSPMYQGPEPFSEVEARNVRDAVMKRKNYLDMYISLQSHDQTILVAGMQGTWAHNFEYDEQWTLANSLIDTIKEQEKKREYHFGSAFDAKYVIQGNVIDWMHNDLTIEPKTKFIYRSPEGERPLIKWTYGIDLPPGCSDSSNHLSISDPPAQIFVTAGEVTAGISAMCRHMHAGVTVNMTALYGDKEPVRYNRHDEL